MQRPGRLRRPPRRQNPRRRVLLDARPIIALFNENDDRWHDRCVAFFGDVKFRFVITEAVLHEVIVKIRKEKDAGMAARAVISFLGDVSAGHYQLHQLKPIDLERISELWDEYSDHELDYADLSLVVAAEHTSLSEIVTIDKDFNYLRWDNNKPFSVIRPDVSLLD